LTKSTGSFCHLTLHIGWKDSSHDGPIQSNFSKVAD